MQILVETRVLKLHSFRFFLSHVGYMDYFHDQPFINNVSFGVLELKFVYKSTVEI